MRWIDYGQWASGGIPDSLPPNAFLEGETWVGEPVVVPSECARLVTSNLELGQMLSRRPRAEVVENFSAVNEDDLSVSVSEGRGVN